MGCVREAPQIEKEKKKRKKSNEKKANMGCVRETPHIKTKLAWDE